MSYVNQNNFIKAVKFIYKNIDKPINLALVAESIGLSVSSLKRLFLEATECSAGTFIRRLRMEQAFRSLQNKDDSILEIALQSGFQDHSAFTRSFKTNFGFSPTCARNKINLVDELECITLEEPEIIETHEITVQAVTKQGLYFECAPLAWDSLKNELSPEELHDDFVGTFIGIGHDDPHHDDVAEHKVRFSAGVAHLEHNLGLTTITIAAGTYAKFNYQGKLNNLGLAYHYIYGAWNTASPIKIDHTHPAFMVFDKFPHDLDKHTVAIYVPIAKK